MFVKSSSKVTEQNLRWNTGSSQHLSLHGVQAFALTDAQFDLHSVVSVVLKEEAVVDDKLSIGSCAIEDVDLRKEKTTIVGFMDRG